jgi:hypothetical protein
VRQARRHPANAGPLRTRGVAAAGGHDDDERGDGGNPQHLHHVPGTGADVASLSLPGTVKVVLMPMLHGCAFPGCSTFTLSTYCVEHELLVRAVKESERAHTISPLDEPLTAELKTGDSDLATEPAQL